MPESELGFPGKLGKQLFKAGPASWYHYTAVASEALKLIYNSKAGHAGNFFNSIPFLMKISPFTDEASVHRLFVSFSDSYKKQKTKK